MPDTLLAFQKSWQKSTSAPLRFLGPGIAEVPASDYDLALVAGIVPARGLGAEERLGAYRRQYWYRLFTLLQEEYPLAGHLLGWERFNLLADRYLRSMPIGRNLTTIGTVLPSWLRSIGAENQLVEACRVDAAWSRCFHAETLPAPSEGDLAALAAGTLDLILQPSVQILRTDRDWLGLRALLTDSDTSAETPEAAPAVWILSRQGSRISWDSVDPRLGKLLDAMRRGSGWIETLDRAAKRSPSLLQHVPEWFALGASRQWWSIRK